LGPIDQAIVDRDATDCDTDEGSLSPHAGSR
jgi:hypothetical protein